MILIFLAFACCLPWPAAPGTGGPPEPFLVSPVTIETEVGYPFDHGSRTPGRALMFTGSLVPGRLGHFAYDFPMPPGTPIVAAADGVVLFAADTGSVKCDGFQSTRNVWIKLDHGVQSDGARYLSRYYHLNELRVTAGQQVRAGQLIGLSGNTGCSTGPHLHFSVARVDNALRPDGRPLDPYGWAGAGPDPGAAAGRQSAWLWKAGRAPPVVRRRSLGRPDAPDLSLIKIKFLDGLAPIDGEWVEIGLRRTARGPRRLGGTRLRNHSGDVLTLPDVALAPGETLRIWTRRTAPGSGEISWGLDHEAWSDGGDCAMLLDRAGIITVELGTSEESCRGRPGTLPPPGPM